MTQGLTGISGENDYITKDYATVLKTESSLTSLRDKEERPKTNQSNRRPFAQSQGSMDQGRGQNRESKKDLMP